MYVAHPALLLQRLHAWWNNALHPPSSFWHQWCCVPVASFWGTLWGWAPDRPQTQSRCVSSSGTHPACLGEKWGWGGEREREDWIQIKETRTPFICRDILLYIPLLDFYSYFGRVNVVCFMYVYNDRFHWEENEAIFTNPTFEVTWWKGH